MNQAFAKLYINLWLVLKMIFLRAWVFGLQPRYEDVAKDILFLRAVTMNTFNSKFLSEEHYLPFGNKFNFA